MDWAPILAAACIVCLLAEAAAIAVVMDSLRAKRHAVFERIQASIRADHAGARCDAAQSHLRAVLDGYIASQTLHDSRAFDQAADAAEAYLAAEDAARHHTGQHNMVAEPTRSGDGDA